MESSEVLRRVVEEKQARKWRFIKLGSQIAVIAIVVAVVSLFISALIINRAHIESSRSIMLVCVLVTEAVSVVGMILLTIWTQL
jgi:hypothetical protein